MTGGCAIKPHWGLIVRIRKRTIALAAGLLVGAALVIMAMGLTLRRLPHLPCPGPNGSNADVYSCRER
jgi:hypothetical protein